MTLLFLRNPKHSSAACIIRVLFIVSTCIVLQACSTPVGNLDLLAGEQGFTRDTIKAGGYRLLVYDNQLNDASSDADASRLHVYLEGDGSPWRYRTLIMPDPTPRNPLMLRLMAREKQHAIYIGRPCYNGASEDSRCDNRLWTSARYSEQVIGSMAAGIKQLADRYQVQDISLFGHSGGGALAMLLAERLPQVTRVITIAGNLDTEAWTRHHRYTPLYGSLNPARRSALSEKIDQWHLLGGKDTVIPPQLVRPFILRQKNANGFLLKGFDHGCCWQTIWDSLLNALAHDNPTLMPSGRFKVPEHPATGADNL